MQLLNGYQGIEMYMFKMCLLLYADDIVLFSQTPDGLQIGFNIVIQGKWRWMSGKQKLWCLENQVYFPWILTLNIMEK